MIVIIVAEVVVVVVVVVVVAPLFLCLLRLCKVTGAGVITVLAVTTQVN